MTKQNKFKNIDTICSICLKLLIINCQELDCKNECKHKHKCQKNNVCLCELSDIIKQLVADKIELETNLETLLNEKTAAI